MRFLLVGLLLLSPETNGVDQPVAKVPESYETLASFDRASGPVATASVGAAADLTPRGDALLFMSDALRRLDLKTGVDEQLVAAETLSQAGVVDERSRLFATAESDRIVLVTGGAWNCPWHVFLIDVAPTRIRTLTEEACGEISLAPSRKILAVVTSETCEGRACGKRQLRLFSIATGATLFEGPLTRDYVDLFWDSDDSFLLRYQDSFDEKLQRYSYKAVSVQLTRNGAWDWSKPVQSPKPREKEIDIQSDGRVRLKASVEGGYLPLLDVRPLFSSPPRDWDAGTPRVFRAGDRIVAIRPLVAARVPAGESPRHSEQIIVLRLKSGDEGRLAK